MTLATHVFPELAQLRTRPVRGTICLVARIIFAVIFLWSGWLKLQDPVAFLMDIRSFQILGDPWAAYVALGLPWLEILCGAAVLLGPLRSGALMILIGSLVVFLLAIMWSWHRGLDISCGCFGKSTSGTDYPELIIRDVIILGLGLVTAVLGPVRWR